MANETVTVAVHLDPKPLRSPSPPSAPPSNPKRENPKKTNEGASDSGKNMMPEETQEAGAGEGDPDAAEEVVGGGGVGGGGHGLEVGPGGLLDEAVADGDLVAALGGRRRLDSGGVGEEVFEAGVGGRRREGTEGGELQIEGGKASIVVGEAVALRTRGEVGGEMESGGNDGGDGVSASHS